MRTLLNTVETFRVDTEEEAKELIEEVKDGAADGGYIVTNYNTTYKEKKAKGELVADGYAVRVTKQYHTFWFDF